MTKGGAEVTEILRKYIWHSFWIAMYIGTYF